MYGAIIGDLVGSIYEFEQTKKVSTVFINKLIEENSFFSDDTILTIAILDAILQNGDYEEFIKKYIEKYRDYQPNFHPYFENAFSSQLLQWYQGKCEGRSRGNGAMMRISPIGFLFDTENDVVKQAALATATSHYSMEAIDAAQTVALIIYYGRLGMSKSEILSRINRSFPYHPFLEFNTTCHDTLPNCLFALFSSNNFEEAIRKVVSYGGDTDTNACIVGSMAEALYGIDENLILLAKRKIPYDFVSILDKGYSRVKKYPLC